MKNWWEEDEEFDFSGRAQDPFEAEKSSDDKSFEEVFSSLFDDMPLRQQIETAYDYYDKPQTGQAYQMAGEPVAFGGQEEKNTMVQTPMQQVLGGLGDMVSEYFKMKKHGYKNLDDYHHCKANYNAAQRGPYGYNTAKTLGDAKEQFDFYWNQAYKGMEKNAAQKDRLNDLTVNADGRLRGDLRLYDNAQDACADYRKRNPAFPQKYW